MKNVILFFCFLMTHGLAIGQLKVVTSGDIKIGDIAVAPQAKLHVKGTTPGFGTQLLRIEDTDGFFNVSDGTSTPGAFVPTFRFASNGFNGLGGIIMGAVPDARDIQGSGNTGAVIIDGRKASNAPLTGARLFVVRNHATGKFVINANGNVGIGDNFNPSQKLHVNGNILATGTVTPSDANLKKNIKDLGYGLKEVLRLNTKSYTYNGRAGISDKTSKMGLLAQELKKIMPELVGEYEHISYTNQEKYIDAGTSGGKLDASDVKTEKFLYIKGDQIKFILINAIKEQQAMIHQLTEEVTELKSKIK